jgi:hypothetical protein
MTYLKAGLRLQPTNYKEISHQAKQTDMSEEVPEMCSFRELVFETVASRENKQKARKRRRVQHAVIVTSLPYKSMPREVAEKKS